MVKELLLKDMVINNSRQMEQRKHLQKSPKLNQQFGKLIVIFSQQPAI